MQCSKMQWLVLSYEIRKQSEWIALHEEDDVNLKSGPVIIMHGSIPLRNQETRRMKSALSKGGRHSRLQACVP